MGSCNLARLTELKRVAQVQAGALRLGPRLVVPAGKNPDLPHRLLFEMARRLVMDTGHTVLSMPTGTTSIKAARRPGRVSRNPGRGWNGLPCSLTKGMVVTRWEVSEMVVIAQELGKC
jgi:hypothetical protein